MAYSSQAYPPTRSDTAGVDTRYGVIVLEPIRNQEHRLIDLRIKWVNDWMLTNYGYHSGNCTQGDSLLTFFAEEANLTTQLLEELDQLGATAFERPLTHQQRVQWRLSRLDNDYIAFLEFITQDPDLAIPTTVWHSELRLREIAEHVNDVFWIHSAQPFQLVYLNPAFERSVGYSAQQLTENPELLLKIIVEEDRPRLLDDFIRYSKGEVLTGQYRFFNTKKMIRWFDIRTFITNDDTGQVIRYSGIANDITSQKEKELVLHQSFLREKELSRLKSQFVSIASHEFRTPLATIQSSVDLVSLYLDKSETVDKSAVRRHLTVIEAEIAGFSKLLSDVLTIGKMSEGKLTFNPRLVDFVALSYETITTHFGLYGDTRTVEITVAGLPYIVYLDDKLIKHVLINLLANAFKFSTDNPELYIQFTKTKLLISVRDRGIGIPGEDIPSLFQPFFRAGNATSVQGTGLGLAISRQFVELHGGRLDVISSQNKGATFTVTLPTNRPVSESAVYTDI